MEEVKIEEEHGTGGLKYSVRHTLMCNSIYQFLACVKNILRSKEPPNQ